MVDMSDFIDPDDEDLEDGEDAADAPELVALRDCLQALADAIASTNLAVINGAQGDVAAAGSRVQASVVALKRFADAFTLLKGEDSGAEEED